MRVLKRYSRDYLYHSWYSVWYFINTRDTKGFKYKRLSYFNQLLY